MSGDAMAAVLAAVTRLEPGLNRMEAGHTQLRVELMARMDRLQHRMDSLDEHLTMGLGHSDRVERRANAVAEDNRLLGQQMISLEKLVRQLEGRVHQIEDKLH